MKRIFSIILLIVCLFALAVLVAADEPLIYNDIRTNASFILPKDWKQASLSKDYDFIDAKFADAYEPSRIILYSSSDVFGYSTESERNGCTRADYHVDSLLPEDFEGMYGIVHEDIAVVTKGENKYFIFPVTQTQEIYELSLNVTMTCAVTMYDGYMYMFQYSGDPKSSGYLDFISVLESASFPKSIPEGSSPQKTLTFDSKQEYNASSAKEPQNTEGLFPLLFSLTVAIGVTFISVKLVKWCDARETNKPTHTIDEYNDWLAYQNEQSHNPNKKGVRGMKTVWTVAGNVPMTIDKDFFESELPLSAGSRDDIEGTFATLYYGRAVLPFVAAVYVGLTSDYFVDYMIFPIVAGVFAVFNHLFHDDIITVIFRYLFCLFHQMTFHLGFVATPIIISIYQKSPLFAVAFLIDFVALRLLYWIVDAIYQSHIKSKYKKWGSPLLRSSDLTDDDIISLWDRKCLAKLYAFQRSRLQFPDYITYYFESILEKRPVELCGTLLNRLEEERKKKEQAATGIQTPTAPEPEPLPTPAPAPAKPTVADQIAADEARYRELQEKISRIPAKKVKEMHAEGKITDEQFMQIAKKYNKLRAEMRDIRERIEVLKQIENSPED